MSCTEVFGRIVFTNTVFPEAVNDESTTILTSAPVIDVHISDAASSQAVNEPAKSAVPHRKVSSLNFIFG